jgi:hypothetical protein
MRAPELDRLIGALGAQTTPQLEVEQRVWSKIAQQGAMQNHGLSFNGSLGWRLSAGAIALAVSAGFIGATLTPITQTKPIRALETWVTPGTSIAPSTILGG